MKVLAATVALIAVASQASALLCSVASSFPYAGQNIVVPLVQRQAQAPLTAGPQFTNIVITINGYVRVVDSCSFQLVNVSAAANLLPVFNLTWIGLRNAGDTVGATASDTIFSTTETVTNGTAATFGPVFRLSTVAGREISWSEIKQLTLFSQAAQFTVAVAEFPLTTSGSAPTTTAGGSSAVTTTAAAASPTRTSGASHNAVGIVSVAIAVILAVVFGL